MTLWTHVGPSFLAAFMGALVEFVEALTIVLAVGAVRGWRPALEGTAAGVALLVALVALFGPVLSHVPLHLLQLGIGLLLLLFGMRWLRKAILRGAGQIALHDEDAIYASETAELRLLTADRVAAMTAFKAVVLEGVEVVFIVIGVGAAGGLLVPASLGALLAGAIVVGAGFLVHRPLARVPENALKFAVGVMISAYGIFWVGEGLGFPWVFGDWTIVVLAAALLAVSLVCVRLTKAPAR
ncbi:MAG TPA: hypothetical protein VF449_02925 [Parvibaculum sp.]